LRIVINEIQQHAWIVFIFFLFFSQIKELELKLKQQEHDRSAVELNVTPIKICYLWLCYMKWYLSIFLFVLSDQRAGAQVEGTRTRAICCGTKGDSLNDVLSSILLYDLFYYQYPAFFFLCKKYHSNVAVAITDI